MAKRKSTIEELFSALYELTEVFWVVGAVVSGFLVFGSFVALEWVVTITSENSLGWLSEVVNNSWVGYAMYLLPILLFLLALIFAGRSINTYVAHHN